MGGKEYLRLIIKKETNTSIKEQLIAILGEEGSGERPTEETPKSIFELFEDGYIFFGDFISSNSAAEGLDLSVLDICCGKGSGLKHLGNNALGVDIAENDNDLVYEDDLFNPHRKWRFDVVSWLQGIEHFEKEDSELILETIKNIYRPETVLISTINKDCNPWIDGEFILTGKYNPYHLNEFDAFEFQELAKHFSASIFISQYWVDGQSVFVNGLYEDAINFYMVGEY